MSTRIAVVLGVAVLVLTMGVGGCRRTARPQEGTSPDETSQPATSRSAADSSVGADPSGDESATASEVANDGAPAVAPAPPAVPVAAPKGPDPRYATPKETVKTVLEALLHGDKAAFINGINATEEMAPLVGSMFDMVGSMMRMKNAIEAEYGPEGWMVFQNLGGHNWGEGLARLNADNLEKATVTERGDHAEVNVPGGGAMKLIRQDGEWLMDLTGERVPSAQERDMIGKMMPRMVQAMDSVTAQVGQPDQTPEKLRDMWMGQMMAVTMQAAAEQQAAAKAAAGGDQAPVDELKEANP